MGQEDPTKQKSRPYVPFVLISVALVAAGTLVLRRAAEPQLTFAAEKKGSDSNEPKDVNEPGRVDKEEPQDANEEPLQRPDHNHPAFSERVRERDRMVTYDIENRGVNDPNVLRAMRTVPRHAFVQRWDLRRAYADHPLPIGRAGGRTMTVRSSEQGWHDLD